MENNVRYKEQQAALNQIASELGVVASRPDYHGKTRDKNTVLFYTKEDEAHNRKVGGVNASAHTRGYAVDIKCLNSHTRFQILQAALEAGFRRIELAPTWIHVDTDPDKPCDVAFYQSGGNY